MHVLLIEDNPGDAELIRHSMSAYADKWQVTHATTLADGVEAVSTGREFDVALLDLTLPDSDGFETFREFNAAASHVPVVVLSNLENQELAVSAMRAGAQDFLYKSATEPHRILRSLQYAIERSSVRAAGSGDSRFADLLGKGASVGPTAGGSGAKPKQPDELKARDPAGFAEAVCSFKQIVELSIDALTFRIDHRIGDRLDILAEMLGRRDALASDAFAVYRVVIHSLNENAPATRRAAVDTEAQLMLTGLLGKLVSHYRKRAIGEN